MRNNSIRSVLILGGGTAGWMAAAVMAKACGRQIAITLVESDRIGTVGVGEATIPQIRHINAFLGFDEADFLRATKASYKLGIQFNGWGAEGESYLHAFGDIGAPLGLTPFHHYWLRGRDGGAATVLDDYSLNAAAALQERFAPIERIGQTRLSGMRPAYHFDAGLYAAFLRRSAESDGVRRIEGEVADATRKGERDHIASVTLQSGETLAADLFIDCSGFRAVLIEGVLSAAYDDWSHWLPCDRAVAVPCEHGARFRPFTQATAHAAGWQWRIPLQHRVGNGLVYSSAYMSDDAAHAALLANLEGAPLDEPRQLRFTTGMRAAPWTGNVVALGLSAGFLEPLESTSIHLIQSGIDRLIKSFPDRSCDPALAAEYNRQTRFEYETVRDFLIAHYHLNRRAEPFWKAMRAMAIPESLTQKIAIFRASGQIHRKHDELFAETAWLQLLLGQGVEPVAYHPLADALEPQALQRFLSDIAALIARETAKMPSHREFLDRVLATVPTQEPIHG